MLQYDVLLTLGLSIKLLLSVHTRYMRKENVGNKEEYSSKTLVYFTPPSMGPRHTYLGIDKVLK